MLLVRPDAPDASANVSKKPFSAPGTYVIYNASSQLTADVVVQCSGQEQTWTFLAEADPSVGPGQLHGRALEEQRARPADLPEQLLILGPLVLRRAPVCSGAPRGFKGVVPLAY